MQHIEQFDFFPLTFDDRGKLTSKDEFTAFRKRAAALATTDAVFLAHGFRNDVNDATRLYTDFLKNFRAHLSRPEFHDELASRQFIVAGVYWPSKPFREVYGGDGARGLVPPEEQLATVRGQLEELARDASPAHRAKLEKAEKLLPKLEGSPKAQDEFVALVLSVLDHAKIDPTEGLPQIQKRRGSDVLGRLQAAPGEGLREPRRIRDAEGSRGIGDVFGHVAGAVGQFLNLTTWYVMKDRSGAVGANGVADAVRAVHAARPDIRIHLVGHSLGGRLMAACTKALCTPPPLQPDSVTLLEAAFSHYGFSPDNGHGTAGFFRQVIDSKVVRGPFLSTFSAQDTVVGYAYSIMSRLAGDNTREIGDASDEFGGIGRNGPQKTKEIATSPLHAAGKAYAYKLGVINNLDGSGGLIKDHGDVTNPAVTYAFTSAVART